MFKWLILMQSNCKNTGNNEEGVLASLKKRSAEDIRGYPLVLKKMTENKINMNPQTAAHRARRVKYFMVMFSDAVGLADHLIRWLSVYVYLFLSLKDFVMHCVLRLS